MPEIVFHSFRMGDVEDPYLYAAMPIGEWQQTEHGQWCMSHVQGEAVFWCHADPTYMGYRVNIKGQLSSADAVFHELKWGQKTK